MPPDWKQLSLGEFVRLQRGHDLTASEQRSGLVPVMGSAGQNGTHSSALALGPGVVIGRSGASMGRVHYCEQDFWPHNTCLYVTDFLGNNPLFAYYKLSQLDLARYNSGSAQPSLNRNYIYGMPLEIPGRDAQDKVARVIHAFDRRIDLNRRINQTLEALAQAIFKSWFVDFDPVKAKIAAKAEGRDPLRAAMSAISGKTDAKLDALPPEQHTQLAATAALFPDEMEDSELGEIPKGWSASSFGAVSTCFDRLRIPLSSREREKRQGTVPYYGATSVMDYVDEAIFDDVYLLLGEDGSVLKPDGTPFVQYIWGKSWVNNHAHVLQGTNGVSTEQLMLFISTQNISAFVTGAVQLKLNQKNMNSIPFIKAPLETNKRFGELISPFFAKHRTRVEETRTLTELRDSLLPRLLSGELKVHSTEPEVAV
jgi:type I restriction enzyme S subunit